MSDWVNWTKIMHVQIPTTVLPTIKIGVDRTQVKHLLLTNIWALKHNNIVLIYYNL